MVGSRVRAHCAERAVVRFGMVGRRARCAARCAERAVLSVVSWWSVVLSVVSWWSVVLSVVSWWLAVSVGSVAAEVKEGIRGLSVESSQWLAGAAVLLLVSSVVALALLLMGAVGGGISKGIVDGCRQRWHQ